MAGARNPGATCPSPLSLKYQFRLKLASATVRFGMLMIEIHISFVKLEVLQSQGSNQQTSYQYNQLAGCMIQENVPMNRRDHDFPTCFRALSCKSTDIKSLLNGAGAKPVAMCLLHILKFNGLLQASLLRIFGSIFIHYFF